MTIFVISDTHFDHTNCIFKYRNPDDTLLRGQFATGGWSDEAATLAMNEHIVERWNSVVKPSDHVYHLGDVGLTKKSLRWVSALNGHKRLIPGNHDIYKMKDYLDAGFEKICGTRVLSGLVLTHVPIHPMSMSRWIGNVHGHIHTNPTPDGPYVNVGVEVLDYVPISIEECVIRARTAEHLATGFTRPLKIVSDQTEEIELLGAE